MADKENPDYKENKDDDQQYQAVDNKSNPFSSAQDNASSNENVADRASRNDDNQIDHKAIEKELRPSMEEANEGGGISKEDYGQYSPADSTQFDEDTQNMTTESPEERHDNNSDNDLSGLGDPIDSDLSLIKQRLTQDHHTLANLDMKQPDALDKLRDVLLLDNKAEQKMYHLLDQLEYSSANYSEIKDKLVDSEDKDKLGKYIDELSPLFKVTDKKQMNTFVDAFRRINHIQKDGSLTNLIELADYYDTYFKGQKNNDKKDHDDNDERLKKDSKPGNNGQDE